MKNLNKMVYLNPKIFGAKLKAEEIFVYLNAKTFLAKFKAWMQFVYFNSNFLSLKKFE